MERNSEFSEKVVQVNRVAKKTSGGNRISFSVLVVVGNRQGQVGVGLGKALEVPVAVEKAFKFARKHLVTVPLRGRTIPRETQIKLGAAKILLRPAPQGAGLMAGGPVRVVAELSGIADLSAKIMGTRNKASNVYATLAALKSLSQK